MYTITTTPTTTVTQIGDDTLLQRVYDNSKLREKTIDILTGLSYETKKTLRDQVIDSLIENSEDFHRDLADSEKTFEDYRRYVVDAVCVYLKQCQTMEDIRIGLHPICMFD